MEIKERNELVLRSKDYQKSNELINAMGRGTALSQKLFAVGMLNMHIDETNNVVATIQGSELRKLFNSTSGSLYQHIEELCDKNLKGRMVQPYLNGSYCLKTKKMAGLRRIR